MAVQYVASLAQLPAETVGAKRVEARSLRDALVYLAKFKVIPATCDPKVKLEQFIRDHNWDARAQAWGQCST